MLRPDAAWVGQMRPGETVPQQQRLPRPSSPPRGGGARGARNTGERRHLRGDGHAYGKESDDRPADPHPPNSAADEGGGSEPYGAVGGEGGVKPAGPLSLRTSRWFRDTLRWAETSESTDPARLLSWCCEDFTPRKLKAPIVLCWLVVQVLGILFQVVLFTEIGDHLWGLEAEISAKCGPEHMQHDICLGPSWSLSYSGVLTFPAGAGSNDRSDFDFVIPSDQSFAFEVQSSPPTFLIGIEPQEPHEGAQWKAAIGPAQANGGMVMYPRIPSLNGVGKRYQVVVGKDYSMHGKLWKGSLSLASKFTDSANVQVSVIDSRILHLEDIHKQPQCSFEDSWKNFNERHNGQHHKVLRYARFGSGFFLALSLLLVGLVLPRFYFYVQGGKLLTRVIALKFLVQDIPQQLLIVAYIYAWYAPNGLRCQMCLFHPAHCDDQHPLHLTNLLVALTTMASACSNQLLVQAKVRRVHDEEDECFLWFVRFALLSVSILPFSTAIVVLSSTLLHLKSVVVYIAFGVPTLLGWVTLLCLPLITLCDDDEV